MLCIECEKAHLKHQKPNEQLKLFIELFFVKLPRVPFKSHFSFYRYFSGGKIFVGSYLPGFGIRFEDKVSPVVISSSWKP